MADDKTHTKADIDAAVAAAVAKVQESIDKLETKNAELLDEKKAAERKLRAASEIKPEDLTAAEERADKAEAALKEAQKAAKDATTARDKAVKDLEAETGAGRNSAIDAAIASGVTEIGVVAALAEGFKALHRPQFKAEVVDGKYVVTTLDGKPPTDYFKEVSGTETGKSWIAAPSNSGGDARGGGKPAPSGKTMPRAQWSALNQTDPAAAAQFIKDGGVPADEAA